MPKTNGEKSRLILHLILGAFILVIVIISGEWLGPKVLELEDWIAGQGPKGPVVFLFLFVVLSSLFVPDTVFAIMAGALFGIVEGTLLMFGGGVLGAILNFYLARTLFRTQVHHFLQTHPKFSVVEQAAEREGFRLLLLLRLVPFNPATISYLLGTTSIRFSLFFVTCIGLLPGFFVEVYFGYLLKNASTSKHAAPDSWVHLLTTVVGFLLCAATMIYLIVIARRALTQLSAESGNDN